MSALSAPYFHDEAAAYKMLEAELWPNGRVCPRCQGQERITCVKGGRIGLYRCGPCKRQFTVKVGTVFESSHVSLHQWLQAVYLMCSSKKGISSHQLMRTLDVQYKTAWSMTHRIRGAMKSGKVPPMGGIGQAVEIDPTFVCKNSEKPAKPRGYARKHAVYAHLGKHFTEHDFVRHSRDEYARGETHTMEGFYSVFKRGMKGVYQHCSEKHLHRYVVEFDFRYSHRVRLGVDDQGSSEAALRGIVGKSMTYRRSHSAA